MSRLNQPLITALTWSTCSIALMPAVPYLINSLCMIIWACLAVLCAFLGSGRQDTPEKPQRRTLFLLFGGNFLFFAAALIYSRDVQTGISFLVSELPMFLFPFCIFWLGLPIADKAGLLQKVFSVFWCSTCILTLWIFYNFWHLHLFSEFGRASSFNTILRETAEAVTDKHPDYISIYLVFSIFIAATRLLAPGSPLKRVVYGLSIPLFLLLLLILAARNPILALMIGSVIICFMRIRSRRAKWAVSILLTVFLLVSIRYTPAIYSRIVEVKNTQLSTPVGVYFNSTNIRVGIYKCTWELIRHHPLQGVGTGSEQQLLNACYSGFPTDAYKKVTYNTHNQYANFWLVSGIFSLLLFLGALAYTFYLGVTRKNYDLLFFSIVMDIAFLSENILSRQAGIAFYYFFLCLMVHCTLARQQQPVTGKAAR